MPDLLEALQSLPQQVCTPTAIPSRQEGGARPAVGTTHFEMSAQHHSCSSSDARFPLPDALSLGRAAGSILP